MAPFASTFLLALQFSLTSGIHQGPLTIEVDGKELPLHVVASSEKGKLFLTSDRTLFMNWGNQTRGFLSTRAKDETTPDMFFNFTLLNKELSYDVDLSHVGCSCNAALFFVSMPGYNPDGSVARALDENPYYCDGSKVGGVWCWEFDSIEANQYNIATTPHTCEEKPGQYIAKCDRNGYYWGSAFRTDPKGICPDESCAIDTRKSFRVHQRYEGNQRGQLAQIVNTFVQEGRKFVWESCPDSAYLERMTPAFSGKMAMVFQLWGDTWESQSWLDEMTGCTSTCIAEEAQASFSNIVIQSLPRPGGADLVV